MEEKYLICACESLVLEHGRSLNGCGSEELGELFVLYLNKLLLKEVTPLQHCTALRSCTVANNHITDISALRGCVHLIKLDLHGNQIQTLPGQEVWGEMKDLKLLYLHNNRIRDLSNVESLSACPGLSRLTLCDTPLSLRKNYRHIVVNTICSLKALDYHVISDEEIIEDLTLQGRFKALSSGLQINMSSASSKDISVQSEQQDINEIITKINRILAACSPVLIVQKWIRGYLVRRRTGLISQPEARRTKLHSMQKGSREEEGERKNPFVGAILIDSSSALPTITIKQPVRRVNNTPDTAPLKHITVDLWKIQKDVLQVLPEAEMAHDLKKPSQQQPALIVTDFSLNKEDKVDIKIKESKERDQMPTELENKIEFGLTGQKTQVHKSNPSKDLLKSIKSSATDIRTSIQLIHSTVEAKREPPRLVKDPSTRRYSSQGSHSINLLPLSAIDKAYENCEKNNKQIQKRNLVKQIHSDKKHATYHTEGFLEAKIKQVTVQHQKDLDDLQQGVRQNLRSQYNLIDSVKCRNKKFLQKKEVKKHENAFAKEFNSQHTSVTKTLMRHDRLIRSQEEMQGKIKAVQRLKENREKQRKFMECLQEHRQLVLQIENSSEKVALDSFILQQANSRLQDAQAHVSTMNIQYSTVEPMDKVPVKQPLSNEALLAYE